MKKILQINVTANSGSTGRIAEGIGLAAQQAGFESWIAYGRAARPSASQLIPIGEKFDCLEHGLETRLFDRHGLASRRATREFIQKIETLAPDIIHLHNIHGYYLNYPILFEALSRWQTPVVWTFHDCWPFTGHCAYFDSVGCNRWKDGCHHCPQKKSYPASRGLSAAKRNWNLKKNSFTSVKNMTIITVSKWLKMVTAASFLGSRDIRVIYNGIDTELFVPSNKNESKLREKYAIREDDKILLGVAFKWSNRKGLDDYLALHKILKPGIKIILVGLDEAAIRQLPSGIIGIPRTSSTAELSELYSLADIVLNLSYEETFGLTTVEGFSCGTPGIAYDRTASPELFDDEVGQIVTAGDIPALNSAVDAMLARGKDHYSKNCREYALKHFRREERFQEYVDLYQKLLH